MRNVTDRSSQENPSASSSIKLTPEYIASYRPKLFNRLWLISETDLTFISTGCYIMGTRSGGSPYQHFLRLCELLRAGATMRVMSPADLKDKDMVAHRGAKGLPRASTEKPYGTVQNVDKPVHGVQEGYEICYDIRQQQQSLKWDDMRTLCAASMDVRTVDVKTVAMGTQVA
ncbi:hypothetical protein PspLS_11980 [Pyricularia sp. CBS 133598]|nr:hypothetical protein PspLS_11980 [Pyricularia sp. CBS 133598]